MSDEPSPEGRGPPSRRAALVGLLLMLTLIVGGLFLVHVLRKTSQIQDCVMSGRTNCAPVPSD